VSQSDDHLLTGTFVRHDEERAWPNRRYRW
jgi:hypothetical protein